MLRIAFIDHPYHQVTKSADFFVELLRKRFDVTHYYAGIQAADFVNDIVLGKFDIIVLWQTEYLGPFFLAEKQRVVCVPMYDGTGETPNFFWHHLRQARIINFSHALHNRTKNLGLTSLPLRYMKDPAKFTPTSDYSIPRVVFWQRLPEHGIDSALVRRLVGDDALMHVHNAPDNVPAAQYPTPEANIVTYFDLEVNALAPAMEWGNVFVCPRHAEGIGMAMLEAIARGMVVVAHDAPTHSDYIVNGKTGYLVDFTELDEIDLPLDLGLTTPPPALPASKMMYSGWSSETLANTQFEQIGQTTRAEAIKLYQAWVESEESILNFIEETPHPTGIRITKAGRAHLARETELWHRHPLEFIKRMGFWEDNGICLQDRKLQRKPEKRRIRRRRSFAFKALRLVFRQIKKLRRGYLWFKKTLRNRL